MAYQALYRKYRPHNFEDFIDQDNVKQILKNSIINNKLSHAYLFAGPRGIGKTSMAKIFAKAVNCLNFNENNDVCDKCDNCVECNNNTVDIVEIDAASNNGVDQIRELKNKISIVPSVLKYKIYIIDEVHMLTNSAFNALLKTLEEPPSYVIFILATTEFYEVPETIVSRCQCFNFSRISIDSLVKRLSFIAKEEKIDIDEDTIKEIGYFSNGGLRDAIGVLDKLNSFTNGKVTKKDFESINNLVSHEDIINIYDSIYKNDYQSVLDLLSKINQNGYNFINFIEQLMKYIRDLIVETYVENKKRDSLERDIDIIKKLNLLSDELKHSLNPYIISQVYFLEIMNQNISREIKVDEKVENEVKEVPKVISQELKVEEKSKPRASKVNKEENKINKEVKNNLINNALASANKTIKDKYLRCWENLNEYFNSRKYGKMAQLVSDTFPMVVGDGYMILTTDVGAIIDNIYKNVNLCEELIKKLTDDNIRIVVVLNNDFDEIKTKYVNDMKKGIKYEVIDENRELITKSQGDLVSKAINLFGEDLVDIE
ncbi:MAG: DNA polymerase III subunit gamma/tau [Bacilli bacterium]|nr:DNA polymerase III subunit gamma/tau [Bacilli bacterium]